VVQYCPLACGGGGVVVVGWFTVTIWVADAVELAESVIVSVTVKLPELV